LVERAFAAAKGKWAVHNWSLCEAAAVNCARRLNLPLRPCKFRLIAMRSPKAHQNWTIPR
jgi:hypothetical protein